MSEDNREIWLVVRRALLMIVREIERRYPPKHEKLEHDGSTTVSIVFDE